MGAAEPEQTNACEAKMNGFPIALSTFLGGTHYDSISDVAVKENGEVYVVGYTFSAFLPGQKARRERDAQLMVARFSPGGHLLASTVVGGSGQDVGQTITFDGQGRVVVAGYSDSRDWATRALAPKARPQKERHSNDGPETDVFVAAFNADLSPRWVRRVGGSDDEFCGDVAVDAGGNAFLIGRTESADFPVRGAPRHGVRDADGFNAFLVKITPVGTLSFSTTIGGTNYDEGSAIAVSRSGNVVVAGKTNSADFPMRYGFQSRKKSASGDGWVARLDAAGQTLQFSTYLGGSRDDDISALALARDGSIWVTGATQSADFPLTASLAVQTTHGKIEKYHTESNNDAFVARLSAGGGTLHFSTFLGGDGEDAATDLALDGRGGVWVTGLTASPDFPLHEPFQRVLAGPRDVFVTHLRPGSLGRSSLLGGDEDDEPGALALASNGDVWLGGATRSANFPVRRAYQPRFGSEPFENGVNSTDGFLTRLRFSGATASWRDDEPPTITIRAPENRATFSFLRPFEGEARDGNGSGVARVEVELEAVPSEQPTILRYSRFAAGQRVYWNGYSWESEQPTQIWGRQAQVNNEGWSYSQVPDLRLRPGEKGSRGPALLTGTYTLRATATDRAGNMAVATSSFRVVPDTTHPIVTFTTPPLGMTFRAWNIVGGRVADEGGSGIERVEVNIRRLPPNSVWPERDTNPDFDYQSVADWTGKEWGRIFGNSQFHPIWLPAFYKEGRWWLRDVPRGADLRAGNYRIQVRAFDRVGNSSELFDDPDPQQGYDWRETVITVRVPP